MASASPSADESSLNGEAVSDNESPANNINDVNNGNNLNPVNTVRAEERVDEENENSNVIEKLEQAFEKILNVFFLDSDFNIEVTTEENSNRAELLSQEFLNSARQADLFFIQQRALIYHINPELKLAEEIKSIKNEIKKKDTLIQIYNEKVKLWKQVLDDISTELYNDLENASLFEVTTASANVSTHEEDSASTNVSTPEEDSASTNVSTHEEISQEKQQLIQKINEIEKNKGNIQGSSTDTCNVYRQRLETLRRQRYIRQIQSLSHPLTLVPGSSSPQRLQQSLSHPSTSVPGPSSPQHQQQSLSHPPTSVPGPSSPQHQQQSLSHPPTSVPGPSSPQHQQQSLSHPPTLVPGPSSPQHQQQSLSHPPTSVPGPSSPQHQQQSLFHPPTSVPGPSSPQHQQQSLSHPPTSVPGPSSPQHQQQSLSHPPTSVPGQYQRQMLSQLRRLRLFRRSRSPARQEQQNQSLPSTSSQIQGPIMQQNQTRLPTPPRPPQ